jgi:hypothetical protein
MRMKRIVSRLALALLVMLSPVAATAQSLTVGCSRPPPAYGVVWTAGQWITCLSSLQPWLGYTPLNQAGGAMSGELFVAPSVTSSAPLNFPPGVAPSAPANGDLWFTSAGLFYRGGGVSIGPLASTTSPSFSNPTFTGTATMPDGSTFTSAGGQGFLHIYVNATSDAGGAQKLQVTGNAYVSGGLSVGTTTATTGGAVFGSATSANAASLLGMDYSSGGRVSTWGATNSTYSTLSLRQLHSDGTGTRTPFNIDASGNAQLTGTVSLGSGSADYVTASGGASGGTLTTNAGTMTVASGGGATTIFSDTTVQLSTAGYHTCALLGSDASGNITCGGAPSGYITYNDNVTSNTLAVSGNLYCMNTIGAARTLTLPAAPGNGAYVAFVDCGGTFSTNNLTVAGNGANIMYNAGNMTVSTRYAGGVLRYSLGKTSWVLSPL